MAKLKGINWNDLASVTQLCKVLNSESKHNDNNSVVTKHPDRTNYNIEFKTRCNSKLIVYESASTTN